MNVNDGNGLFDKYGMIDEIARKLDVMADAKGVYRCGLLWDVTQMLKTLVTGMKNEDAENKRTFDEMQRLASEMNRSESGEEETAQ